MNGALPWYVARASGLIAWALLSASVVWGLAISTKVLGGRPRPAWVLDLHRFLGGLAAIFLGVHVGSLLLDTYVHFGLVSALVPLVATWHPVAVAWGIVGMYLLAAVEITSLVRRRLSKRAWRLTHYASFPLFVVATIHGLTAGTDGRSRLFIGVVSVVTATVAALTSIRVTERAEPAGRHAVGVERIRRSTTSVANG
ncbi:MAG: ferric reductase-like transmembrane domain-containing protein [Actinomycetota bacterium]